MRTIVTVIITIICVVLVAILVPLLFGYKIVYCTEVQYNYEAIAAFGQLLGAILPVFLVFLSAYVTKKFDEGKKDIANSNIATVDYIKSIEKELNDKMEKVLLGSKPIIQAEKSKEELFRENKEKAYKFVSISMIAKTQAVADHLGISKEEAFELMQELLLVDRKISCGGSASKENMDNVIWLRK